MTQQSGIGGNTNGSSHGSTAPRAQAARRCYLTVLFCDLSESTQLGAALEAEHYADMLGNIRAACAEIVPRHGGLIVRIHGDGMLAIFGYPIAREDDGRRATEAALDLHDHVRALRPDYLPPALTPLAMHSGIHSGLLLLEEGDIMLGRFELLGNVPNVAAGLAAFAGRNEIVVSEESLGPQANFFVSGRQFYQPKGSADPLAVHKVSARTPVPNRFEARALRGVSPFVGRQDEMQRLQRHFRDAVAGAPQFVTISAGPGMGKTRLVQEFREFAEGGGFQVLKGYCESYLSAEPLQPFLQMLRSLFGLTHGMSAAEASGALGGALATIDPLMAVHGEAFMRLLSLQLPGAAAHPPAEGGATVALHDLVDMLATKRPVLLVIDDWQWADDASRQALHAILDIGRPVFVLLATRGVGEDELIKRRAAVIELSPLGVDDAAQTIQKLLPSTDPFIAADIHRYSGGNPLFIEELCHSAQAQGGGNRLEFGQRNAAWLNALIESRVERLTPLQAQVVRIAAVIGNVFPAWVLEQLTGHEERDPLIESLAEEDFIFPTDQSGMLRFKHGITRDVIYGAVGLHERRAMHLQVASVLGSGNAQATLEDAYEALAYHLGAGGDSVNAARYAELAGDKAMVASALDRARIQYGEALAALDDVARNDRSVLKRWVTVVQKLGVACVFDPLGVVDSVALFTKGLALAREFGSPETVARGEYWLAYICYSKGQAREATRHCEMALNHAHELGDERLAAQVRATLGQVLTSACEYDRAMELLGTAIDAKRRQSRGGRQHVPVGSAYSLSCKGLILGDRGQFDQAHECFAQALDLIKGANHQVESSVRGWMCTVLQWQGRWEEGLMEADQAVRIGAHVKSSHLLAISRALWGYCRWILNAEADALKVIEDATAWMAERQGHLFRSLNHGWLADGFSTLGQHPLARHHAAQAFMRARERDRIGEAVAYRALARAAAQAGDVAGTERYLARAMRCAQARGSPHESAATALCRAEAMAGLERRDDARRALESACAGFLAMKMHWHMDRADVIWRMLR